MAKAIKQGFLELRPYNLQITSDECDGGFNLVVEGHCVKTEKDCKIKIHFTTWWLEYFMQYFKAVFKRKRELLDIYENEFLKS